MLVVDVGVDPEQALQDGLRHGHKVSLKGDALGTKEDEKEKLLFRPSSHIQPKICIVQSLVRLSKVLDGFWGVLKCSNTVAITDVQIYRF